MSGPSASASGAGFSPRLWAPPMYLLFRPAAGAGGRTRGWGRVGGRLLGISLGLAPRVLPSRGLREKVPGYRGTV